MTSELEKIILMDNQHKMDQRKIETLEKENKKLRQALRDLKKHPEVWCEELHNIIDKATK